MTPNPMQGGTTTTNAPVPAKQSSIPAKNQFKAIPIADPDTHPSFDEAVRERTKNGGSSKRDKPQPISPEDLAKGPYKRLSKGVYEFRGDSRDSSRRALPQPRVSCDEEDVKIVTLLTSVSLHKDYGTYMMVWDNISRFRKIPKTSVEPKEIKIQELMEFGTDVEAAAGKNPGGDVGNFVKNNPQFYDGLAILDETGLVRPPPLPHSPLSVKVVPLITSETLVVKFKGELGGKDYVMIYENPFGTKGKVVKVADGSCEKLVPSGCEISAFAKAIIKACRMGDRTVAGFVSRHPDAAESMQVRE